MYPIVLLTIALIAGAIQTFVFKVSALEAFLVSIIVCTIGLQGLWAFMGHFFRADEVAEEIGWPPGNPFQQEIAFVNLGMGVLGIMSIWFRGEFWLATIIGHGIFVMGAGYIHILDIRKSDNKKIYNAGPVLYSDLLMPLVHLGLYVAYAYA